MQSLPIAAQIYTVRDEAEKDFLAVLKEIKGMGYDGVELAGLYHYTPGEVKAMLSEAGLIAISAHVPIQAWMEDPEKTTDAYHTIGCPYVAIPYLMEDQRPGTEGFQEILDLIHKIGRLCADRNMILLYHNHDFEFLTLPNGRYALDELYASVPAELLQTQIDTCWVSVAGVDPAAYIRKYKGRSPIVHLKDYVGSKAENMYDLIGQTPNADKESSRFQFRAVGDGCQNWSEILQASLDAGAKWVVVEQDLHETYTPMEDLRRSREFLRSLSW